jgi:hypothetical protein
MRTTELRVVTLIAVGEDGAGDPATVVEIAEGMEARFETEKLNGPPAAPVVVFRSETVAGIAVLVIVQTMRAAGSTLAAGTVSTLPASVPKLAGLPVKLALVSLQTAAVVVKLAFAPSVICTSVLTVVTWIGVGTAGAATLAAVVVILAGVDDKLVAVNVNGPPNEPEVIFCNATVGALGALV